MIVFNIFRLIENQFIDLLFLPLEILRFMRSWWISNAINFVFIIVAVVYFIYWMKESRRFKRENIEDLTK